MKSKIFISWSVLGLTLISLACSAIAEQHRALIGEKHSQPTSVTRSDADQISGEWNVTFYVHDTKTPATFTFKLEGTKVTGTAYSDHTGLGTIRDGKWMDGKLSFTLDFKKHESIAVTGTLKDGK